MVFPAPSMFSLSRRDERNAPPGQERRTKNRGGWRGNTAEGALPAESGDGPWVRQEESRFLPDAREQFIQIVRGGRSAADRDLECRIDIIEQAIVGVVDQLGLLALFDFFHGQPQLLPDLVVRMTKKIGDAGVNIHHGRDRAQACIHAESRHSRQKSRAMYVHRATRKRLRCPHRS